MSNETKKMVREWVEARGWNTEAVARWMRDALRIGSLRECREMVREAVK